MLEDKNLIEKEVIAVDEIKKDRNERIELLRKDFDEIN